MNIFSLAPLYRFIHLFKTFLFFIFGICFRRKNSTNVDGRGDDDRPIEIVSVGQTGEKVSHWSSEVKRNEVNVPGNDTLVDWNDWKDGYSQDVAAESSIDDANLFQDMEPTLTKPRMLKVKMHQPPDQRTKPASRLQAVDGTDFQVQSELGVWVESSSGWDDEVLGDLSEEAANILKEKRRLERQKRTMEQKKKKEELRAIKAEKKNLPHLGMKVN